MRPGFLGTGVRSVHLGTPILLPQRQHPTETVLHHGPDTPTFWSPYVGLVEGHANPRPALMRPPVNDGRWTPPGLWDIQGLGNMDDRWPTIGNPVQAVSVRTSSPATYGAWFTRLGAVSPTPSLPLPQPGLTPQYG